MTYEQYRAIYAALNAACIQTGAALQAIPGIDSGPRGLTPDAVKFSPEYTAARSAFENARALHDGFVKPFARVFAKQIRADIDARRAAKLAQNNQPNAN